MQPIPILVKTLVLLTHISCCSSIPEDGSYLELYKDRFSGVKMVMRTSGDVDSSFAGNISTVKVLGPAMWEAFEGPGFTGKRVLLKEGTWDFDQLDPVGNDMIQSVQKLDSKCEERPVGVQSRIIVPDEWMMPYRSGTDRHHAEARLYNREDPFVATLGKGWTYSEYSSNTEPGVQVDLGKLYRLYAVATQGTCYCTDTTMSEYYASSYKMAYSTDGITYYTYKEEGVDKIFSGNDASTWTSVVKHTVNTPVKAKYVRIMVLTGRYFGLRLEFYGCEMDLDLEDNVPQTSSYNSVAPEADMSLLVDDAIDTCLAVPPNGRLDMRLPVGDELSSDLDVAITMEINAPCTSADIEFELFVNISPYFTKQESTTFKLCKDVSQTVNGKVYTWKFACSCSYGNCEVVEASGYGLPSSHCASVCEVSYN